MLSLARAVLCRLRQQRTPAAGFIDLAAECDSHDPRLSGETVWVRLKVNTFGGQRYLRVYEAWAGSGAQVQPSEEQCRQLVDFARRLA